MQTKDEKIGNLEEGDLPNEITNYSQCIFTLIQNNNCLFFNVLCHRSNINVKKTQFLKKIKVKIR